MRVIDEETLWSGRFIKAALIHYEDAKGIRRQWEAIRRVDCDGIVIVVPITASGELVLIRQYRPALDRTVIELPAGLVAKDEQPRLTAFRELIEEAGFQAKTLEVLYDGVMSTGINSERWQAWLAQDCTPASEDLLRQHPPDENEDIEPFTLPLASATEELYAIQKQGHLVDIRIYGLLNLAALQMKGA